MCFFKYTYYLELSPLAIEDNSIFVFEGVASDIAMRLNQWNWRIADLGKQHLHLCNTLHYDCQGPYRPLLLTTIILIFDSWSSPCSSVLVRYNRNRHVCISLNFKQKIQELVNFVNTMFHSLWLLFPNLNSKYAAFSNSQTHVSCRVVSLCIWGEKKNWRYRSAVGWEKGGWPYILTVETPYIGG